MQRSITNQKSLSYFIYIILFIIYESLSSIYLFLPPLLSILFILFLKNLKYDNSFFILMIAFCLLIFEAEKGYLIFSSIIYFLFLYKFIIPRLNQNISCAICLKFSYVLLVYIGFYMFSLLLSNIFLLPVPSINYYIVYYIVIEFFIVSIL
ncbi:MAG: hypothetical protein DRG78_20240 [Epsilonproteobacteria bacterium]|nr:MAG: hypothetical protein DRG78_20240 [Campylobacterota bacterium]